MKKNGSGVLYIREIKPHGVLRPLLFGGEQQHGMRPGTEAVGAAVATARAMKYITNARDLPGRLEQYTAWTSVVWNALTPFILQGIVLPTGPPPGERRAPHHVSFCVRNADRQELVKKCDELGLLVSGGSACTSGAVLPSHVLSALAVPPAFIHGSLRITFGPHVSGDGDPKEMLLRLVTALRQILMEYVKPYDK